LTRLPKVSICIASYNHERFFPATLDSALAQTYPNVEIVIVDDGSTDRTFDIAQDYARKHSDRIRLLTHEGHVNRGISATVNLATQQSTGEYWSCLGSDDILRADKIDKEVNFLEVNRDVDWVYSYAEYIDANGQTIRGRFGYDLTRDENPLYTLLIGNRIPGMTALARRACIDRIGEHNTQLLYSDWEFWIRLLSQFGVAFIPQPFVQYRVHGSNVSIGVNVRENARRGLAVFDSLSSVTPSGRLAEPRVRALVQLQRCFHLFCVDELDTARGALTQAANVDPVVFEDACFIRWWLTRMTREYGFLTAGRDFVEWFSSEVPAHLSKMLFTIACESKLRCAHARHDYATARTSALALLRSDPLAPVNDVTLGRIALMNLLPGSLLAKWHARKNAR
jgi:glycosyltransferase involved in cell wall biosynthesis